MPYLVLRPAGGVVQLRHLVDRVVRVIGQVLGVRLGYLPAEQVIREVARLNVDETGHKERGKNLWTWCFRAPQYTLFRIDRSRGSKVLLEALGKDFDGVLGCDYSSA
jgi:hypothetical protein